MTKMKSIFFQTGDHPVSIKETDIPVPPKDEVLIKLHYAALNHLDLWLMKNHSSGSTAIAGSDGSGVVVKTGENVDQDLKGSEVVINPALHWGEKENIQGPDFQILGDPTNGTFSEYIVIPAKYVHAKPKHLSLKEAASLPLAGLTAYRALFTKAQIKPIDKALITGIGGGAALFLLQMAVAAGSEVYVTSSSDEKIKKAIEMGAKEGFNYTNESWIQQAKETSRGFDLIIDSAGGPGFATLLELANPGARIVLFGRTAGPIQNLSPGIIFNKQLNIYGSLMGTPGEFHSMIRFYEEHDLHPVIDKEFSFEEIELALHYLRSGQQFGKVLLAIYRTNA